MTKHAYIEGTTLQLDLWGARLAGLRDGLARFGGQRQRALRRELRRLERSKRSLENRLRRASHATSKDWESERAALEEDVDDFRRRASRVEVDREGV